VFSLKRYQASVMENLPLDPPPPIVQVHAEDMDEGRNGAVGYSIISGNEGGEYRIVFVSIGLILEAIMIRYAQLHHTAQNCNIHLTFSCIETYNQ
jgi:hypothetical protein